MSSAENDTRPVWLTRAQRGLLEMIAEDDLYPESGSAFTEMVAAWDAAPADSAGEVEVAIFAYDHGQIRRAWTIQEREEYAARAALVLAALGYPQGDTMSAFDPDNRRARTTSGAHSELPPDLLRVLRDQGVVIGQDAAVFEVIAQWAKAPSNTASADLPEEQS